MPFRNLASLRGDVSSARTFARDGFCGLPLVEGDEGAENEQTSQLGTTTYDNGPISDMHNTAVSRRDAPDPDPRQQSKRFGASRMAAMNVLKRWFDEHRDCPFPSKQDKVILADQSGLTVTQVATWFANTRRRRKYKSTCHNCRLNPMLPTGSLAIPPPADGEAQESPLERWRNSPPEAEAASLDDIMGAVINTEWDAAQRDGKPSQQSTPSDARSTVSSNASGSAVSNTSASSAYSAGSHSSNGSFGRFYAADIPQRRRRRRKQTAALSKTNRKAAQESRPYQCTFCTDTFRTKYDWTRHERTLHLSLESYTCSPSGPTYTDSSGTKRCAFCDHPGPSDSHIESHSYSRCQEKPKVLRTFYRKDHLVQHLRLVHATHHFLPSMNAWKSQVDRINSRCGLCGERFASWCARNEHLAQHFREGALMEQWTGSRGLDPSVAFAVENAMPPYLIGMESIAPDPFSASRQVTSHLSFADNLATDTDPLPAPAKPSPFECFTVQLTEFVRSAQAHNEEITDNMLQNAGRHIVFGDEDPWNQTPADNAEWLNLFKKGMGLDSAAEMADLEDPLFAGGHCSRQYSDFFMLFSAGPLALWNTLHANPNATAPDPMEAYMAWSWQSPDALASFRQYYTDNIAAQRGQMSEDNLSSSRAEFRQYYSGFLSSEDPAAGVGLSSVDPAEVFCPPCSDPFDSLESLEL